MRLSSTTAATPSFTAPTQLVADVDLEFSLVVRDARGLASTAADTVTVTVAAGPNDAPTAEAGDDQGGVQEGAAVTLDGTGSSDPEGEALSYEWSQIRGTPTVRLSSTTAATPSFTAPTQLVADVDLEFSLVVRDARGLASTAADTVTVTVAAGPNDAPTAEAGIDQGGVQEGAAVTLDGTGSSDPEGEALSYEWSQIRGTPTVRLSSTTAATPSFTAPTQLVADVDLEFSLVVRDARGLASTAADTVTVTVAAGPNDAPTAEAGIDQGGVQEGAAVTLDGTGSSDPESEALSYEWSQIRGTPTVRLSSTTAATPSFTAPTQLVADVDLEFSLVVRDARGLASTAADTVTVTVAAGPNDAPTAEAGIDQRVQEDTAVTLDGTGSSDPEGEALSYEWSQIRGTPTVRLSSTTAATPSFTAPTQLVADVDLEFSLVVRDARGLASTAADTVTVTVADSTAPGLDTTEVNQTTLTLTYDELLDGNSTPGSGAFTVTVADSSTSPTVGGVSIGGSTVTLTLLSAVRFGETVTVSYAVPATNPIQDVSGNDADALNNQAVSNIAEPPTVEVSFSSAAYTAEEGGTAATVTVSLSADPKRRVVIPIKSTPQRGATAQGETGADYSGIPQNVTFVRGETEQTFTVTATDDAVDDDNESVRLSFGTLPPAVTEGTEPSATVQIADDDTRGVTVSENALSVPEGDSATYTVVLDSEPTDTVTVTIDGASGDVTVDDTTLEFTSADWSTSQTVTVSALPDTDGVNDSVTLAHTPSGGGYDDVTVDSVAVTVDSTPRLQSAAVNGTSLVLTYGEALDGTSTPAPGAFTVTVAGAATSPTVSGVSIGASAVTLTLSSAVSFGETLTVSYAVPVTNPIRDTAGNDAEALTEQAVVNETPDGVTVSFSAGKYTAAEGGTAATVRVTLSAAPGFEVTIPIDVTLNGATAQDETGADYSGIPESVTFAIGETEQTFTVTAIDDSVDDDGESISLSFATLPSGVTAGSQATATVTLVDNDTRGVTLSKNTIAVAEGNSATYTVELDTEPTGDVTVTFSSDNTDVTVDTENADNDLLFTPLNWNTPQTVMISAAADDDTVDDTAVISHTLSGADYADVAVESLTVTVTVTEVDSTPRLESAVANRTSLVLTYGEPLDSGSTPAADAFAATVSDSATSHTVSGVSIAGSAVTLTLSPEVTPGETVTVTYVVPAIKPIQDEAGNDAEALTDRAVVNQTVVEVTVSFGAASYTVTEDGTAATVTVTLSADPEREVPIPIDVALNGATAQGEPGEDYSGIPASVAFVSGQTEKTFTVTATDDSVDDDGESISLSFGTLPRGVSAGVQATATVTIADDDVPSWSTTVSPATMVEDGGAATLTVSTGGTVTFADDRTIALALSARRRPGPITPSAAAARRCPRPIR